MKPLRALTAAFAAAYLCVLLAPVTAFAAGAAKDLGEKTPLNLPSDTTAHPASTVGGSGGGLARTFIGLAVVVAVIYGLSWVLRQMKKSSSKDVGAHGFGLSTEASMPLGPNRSVHLIRAGRELVLVGSAEQGITPIRTYSEDEALSLGLIEQPQLTVGDLIEGEAREVASTPTGKVGLLMSGALNTLRERTAR